MKAKVWEEYRRIMLRAAKGADAASVVRDIDALEEHINSHADANKVEYLAVVRDARLRALLFARRPVNECIRPARAVLEWPEHSPLRTLEFIGAFAVHCEELGELEVGSKFLRRAISLAQKEQAALSESLPQYRKILERISRKRAKARPSS